MIDYQYLLHNGAVSEDEFGQLHRTVAKVAEKRRLTTSQFATAPIISDNVDDLNIPPWEHKAAQRTSKRSVGFAYTATGTIWIDGTRGKADQMTTMVHELAHVYQTSDAHGAQWRKFYGQVLTSWQHHQGMPYEDMRRQVGQIVYKYRKFRYRDHPEGSVGAYRDYRRTCENEIRKIMTSCPAAWTATADIW